MNKLAYKFVILICISIVLIFVTSCKQQYNRVKIVNYRAADNPQILWQSFDQCYFYADPQDNYFIVMKSSEPMTEDNKQILNQLLYAKLLWKAIPGRTYAESSQINAKIEYVITVVDNPQQKVIKKDNYITLHYTGSGFIYFSLNRKKIIMTGTIEQAQLNPVEKNNSYPLKRFILSGKFRARKNAAAIAEAKLMLSNF